MELLSLCTLLLASFASALPREKRSPQFYGYGGYPAYVIPGAYPYGGPGFGQGFGHGGFGHPGAFRPPKPYGSAYCRLISANTSEPVGEIYFDQPYSLGAVEISGEIVGLAPGRHGFHIHEMGDTGDMCKAAGPHFNPTNMNHGAPEDKVRHAGDLGNIQVGANGAARFEIADSEISLVEGNPRNIIGRAAVVHEGEDDLGKGDKEDSTTTGGSGARVACCIIEKPKILF